jgi:DNA-binding MarR family transcriptional regulator/GNAT superfamily N-acetyltransferase
MDTILVEQVRSFNRRVTQTVGALHDHYLGRNRPLGESRLLFEIGTAGATASELRARLALDSGYLSRLLRSVERQGFVATKPDEEDRRVRRAQLTAAGQRELAILNRDSDRLAASILAPLNDAQRAKLTAAMGEVERLLSASAVRVDEVAPDSRAAEYCLSHYFAELAARFEAGFDPAQSLAPTLEGFAAPDGTFLVMRLDGELVGCGGFKRDAARTAYLKRMWIARSARGLGLGRRLLTELEAKARTLGYRTIRLETQKSLTEAQQLYRSSGYREVPPFNDEPYAHHWFEKPLR